MDVQAIRSESEAVLTGHDVPIHPHLPLLDLDGTRSAQRVAQRVVALYCMAGLANGADPGMLRDWLVQESALSCLTASEVELLEKAPSSFPNELLNELSWKQESLFVLCWSGGLASGVPWPDHECDLSSVFASIPPEVPVESFVGSFVSAPATELARTLDLYYCLHASLAHPELWDTKSGRRPVKIEVVEERRHALEWLCSCDTEWDEVTLDT